MNSLVVLVAFMAGLVHAAPSGWTGVPLAHSGLYAHAAPVNGAYANGAYGHGAWHGSINIPVVLPSGHLADTHEVSALKHAHAVAVANTPVDHGSHGAVYAPNHGLYAQGAAPVYGHGAHAAWQGPINIPVVLPSGHLADTHEVSALNHAHAVAVANTPVDHGVHGAAYAPVHGVYAHGAVPVHGAYAHGASPTYGHGAHAAWHGPINIPVVLPSGHLADTPEVAHLKAAHVARLHGAHY